MNIDFKPNVIPHALQEVGGVDSGKWQLTLHPHGDTEIVLPTVGSIVEVYDAADAYLKDKLPGRVLA